jgi:competence protein ComEA
VTNVALTLLNARACAPNALTVNPPLITTNAEVLIKPQSEDLRSDWLLQILHITVVFIRESSMKKQWIGLLFAFMTAWAWAGMDANTASKAELESVKGVGPSTAQAIVDARKSQAFTNWEDLIGRVKGIGPAKAAGLSAQGLSVGGKAYTAAKVDKAKATANKTMAKVDKPKPNN